MTKPRLEAIKSGARLVVLYIASWVITEVLAQIANIPATYDLTIYGFLFSIPVRLMIQTGLTLINVVLDKYIHEIGKAFNEESLVKGLTRF